MSDTIQQSRIALRKFQSAEFASEETLCFSAVVVFDGKPIADAKNEGRGGATFFYPHKDAEARFAEAEAFAKSFPPVNSEYTESGGQKHQFTITVDLEYIVDQLASEMHLRAAFNRDIAGKTLFIKDNQLIYLKGVRLNKVANKAALFRELRSKHGAEVILAELPREEAFVLWRKHSGAGG
jgi:hypothetical protein